MKRFTSLTKIMLVTVLLLIVGLMSAKQVSAQTSVPTEQEAYNSINALRSEYYEGRRWTNSNSYKWKGGVFGTGYGCGAFAFICSDAAFGTLPARQVFNVTMDKVHVGDILRVKNDTHAVVVLSKSSSKITVTEGNYNSSIHWGRTLTAAEVEAADYLITRYPVGTFNQKYTVSFDANGGTGAPVSVSEEYDVFRLTYQVPSRVGYQCEGWALTPNASSVKYRPGDLFNLNRNTTLYAVWSEAKPVTVSSFPCTKNAAISIPGSAAYYKITAPLSGIYTISASSSSDTIGVLYDSSWNKITSNDDYNGSADFCIIRHLDKGETYYVCARYYPSYIESKAANTTPFTVRFSLEADAVQPKIPLRITKQPQDVVTNLGEAAVFALEAAGENVSYQWYFKTTANAQFSLWSGKTASAISYKPTSMAKDGMLVYCVVTDEDGQSVQSATVTMTINQPEEQPVSQPTETLEITRQPQNLYAEAGETVRFSIEAKGEGVTYAWYYKNSGASSFTRWDGRNTAGFNFTAGLSKNGLSVYCVVADSFGNSVTSNTITLTVTEPSPALTITRQPQNLTANAGESVRFSIEAQGDGLTYAWYFKTSGSSQYTYWSGRTTAAFNFTTNSSKNGLSVYCVVSDVYGNSVTSNTMTLTVIG